MRSAKLSSPNDYPEIPEERRRLMLKVFAGDTKHLRIITTALHFLDCHFPVHKLDAALSYLVKNHLVGARLVAFMAEECGYSYLEFQRELLKRIEKETEAPKIIAGKDFRL